MAEWSIAAVLKTVDPKGSGGSNPSLSANPQCRAKAASGAFVAGVGVAQNKRKIYCVKFADSAWINGMMMLS